MLTIGSADAVPRRLHTEALAENFWPQVHEESEVSVGKVPSVVCDRGSLERVQVLSRLDLSELLFGLE